MLYVGYVIGIYFQKNISSFFSLPLHFFASLS